MAVVLVACLAAWPALSQPGLLNTRGGGDSPFLLQRLHQLTAALADGHFPVRWMPDAAYGDGYPFYNFYAPLSIYIAAAFRFLGFSFVRAIHLAQLTGFIVAGLGTYYLARRWLGSEWAGLLAAVAYTVAPFHMVNVYVRGDSLAEFWAMAFYSWVLLAAHELVAGGERRVAGGDRRRPTADRRQDARHPTEGVSSDAPLRAASLFASEDADSARDTRHSPLATRIALFALAYAALILSHNISALIFSPFLLLYLALRVWQVKEKTGEQGRQRSTLLPIAAALALAFALAAWFFVPALAEQGLAQLGPVTEGYFHYSNHFRGLDLVQGGLLFDYNPDGGVAFRMGLVQAGLAVAGVVALLWRIRNYELGIRNEEEEAHAKAQRGKERQEESRAKRSSWRSLLPSRPLREQSSPATRHPPPATLFFITASFLLATFMLTPLSRPLWDHLPLLSFTQFPWRFLSVQALFGALLTGGLVSWVGEQGSRGAGVKGKLPSPQPSPEGRGGSPLPPRSPAPLLAIGAGLILIAAALLGLTTDHLILTDADVTAERLAQYEWFTGNIGTTVSAEYLTPAADPRPWTSAWLNNGQRDRAVAVVGELSAATLRARTATRQTWELSAGLDGATVVLPTLTWPGWRATVDGQPTELTAQPGSGLMTLAVPAGAHTVALELGRTPVRAAAEWVSLVAAVVVVASLVIGRWARPPTADRRPLADDRPPTNERTPVRQRPTTNDDAPPTTRHSPPATWILLTVYCLLLTALALAWRNDPRELPPGDLTWDFAQMAYLHHDPDGVAFEGGARLYEYGYSADELTAGEMLTVTLSVAPGDGRVATLALVTPAAARPTAEGAATPPVVTSATLPLSEATAVFVLPIPPDAPPGLYVPRLTLDGARPLLPSGGTRGDLFLRPVRLVGRVGNPPLPLRSTAGEEAGYHPALQGDLEVQTLGLTMRDATTLDGRFAWYTARPLGARAQFSWRLQDAAGGVPAQLDAQPGYGFQPSTLWPAGEWTADWLALRLPAAAPAEGDYPLVMRLYDPGDGRTLLTRRVGVMTWAGGEWQARLYEPNFALPNDLRPTTATFGNDVSLFALPGYQWEQNGDTLRLTLIWQAVYAPGDFTRFAHLLDAGGNIVAQVDGAPAGDSYPTGQWLPGEIVADALTFDLSALPPGDYRVAVGFYAPTEGLPRLSAADAGGPLPDGRFLLPDTIVVE